jgi:hypothetical protein
VTTLSAADLVLTPAEQADARLMRDIKSLSVKYRGLAHLVPAGIDFSPEGSGARPGSHQRP